MHQYLDSDGSGTSATCVSSTIGVERVSGATAWLKANGKKGFLGEYAGGANSVCQTAITGMLQHMQSNSDVWAGATWWGGGPWWGELHVILTLFSCTDKDFQAIISLLLSLRAAQLTLTTSAR